MEELEEFFGIIRDSAQDNKITGIAFVTINANDPSSGTAYTMSCKDASHLLIAGIETLRYRFIKNFMEED